MSNDRKPTDTAKTIPLNDEQLDKAAGGLNPQPLPPRAPPRGGGY